MNKQQLISRVTEIIQKDSDLEVSININDVLTDIGINSLNFIRMVVHLEEAFDVEFPDEALEYDKFNTIAEISDYLVTLLSVKK